MQKLCKWDSYALWRSILSRTYNRLFKSRYNRSRTLFSLTGAIYFSMICFSIRSFSLMALKNIRILHLGFLCVSLKSLFFKATKNKGVLSYGFLCFMLFNLSTAQAQSPENGEAAEGQNEIKPLVIGQLIPEEFWTREHLFFIDGDTIRQDISGHKGKHLIIASWSLDCGSCLTSLPRLQQLQEAFGEHIHILLV